jgi:hypothetical protein
MAAVALYLVPRTTFRSFAISIPLASSLSSFFIIGSIRGRDVYLLRCSRMHIAYFTPRVSFFRAGIR